MILDMFRLDDKVAVITGGGRGLGAAIALAFAQAGADVLIASRTSSELDAVAEQIRAAGRRAHTVAADLAHPEVTAQLAGQAVGAFGKLDIVVNNVGGTMPNTLLSTSTKDLADAFAFNVGTAHALTVAAVPLMLEHDLAVETDPDLIESANFFEGRRVGPGDGAWRDPRVWWQLRNPFTPSWGEPYVDIAARMTTAVDKARVRGAGHEVVCVSHQLPVWTLRLYLTGKRLWHDPRRRDCALASVTSLIYDGDRLVDVVYSQPAAL